jgi:hypothetical protein
VPSWKREFNSRLQLMATLRRGSATASNVRQFLPVLALNPEWLTFGRDDSHPLCLDDAGAGVGSNRLPATGQTRFTHCHHETE